MQSSQPFSSEIDIQLIDYSSDKKLLSLPATCEAAERFFKGVRLIVTGKHLMHAPHYVNKLIPIHDSHKLLKFLRRVLGFLCLVKYF